MEKISEQRTYDLCWNGLVRYILGVVANNNTFLIHSQVQNQLRDIESREAEMNNICLLLLKAGLEDREYTYSYNKISNTFPT